MAWKMLLVEERARDFFCWLSIQPLKPFACARGLSAMISQIGEMI